MVIHSAQVNHFISVQFCQLKFRNGAANRKVVRTPITADGAVNGLFLLRVPFASDVLVVTLVNKLVTKRLIAIRHENQPEGMQRRCKNRGCGCDICNRLVADTENAQPTQCHVLPELQRDQRPILCDEVLAGKDRGSPFDKDPFRVDEDRCE